MPATLQASPQKLDELPPDSELSALVQRVAASKQFRLSVRLRDFLLYVGKQSLKEGCPEIHEQDIGTKVFGRPETYDRSQDNIVRVNATELRKRIEVYFTGEGAEEPVVFEIPRGGYRAVFHRRAAVTLPAPDLPVEPGVGHEGSAEVHPAPPPPILRGWWTAVLGATAAVLGIVCLVLLLKLRDSGGAERSLARKPAVSALWATFLEPGREANIVLADASVSLSQDIAGQPMPLQDYLNHEYLRQLDGTELSADRRSDLEQVFHHNLVAFGDVAAAEQIMSLTGHPSNLHLTLSRFFSPDSLKRRSAVLIGGKKANPWVQLFDGEMAFSLDYDTRSFVANRHPRPGEQPMYYPTSDMNGLLGYSVVAFLPNLSHSGDVLILAGTDSDATTAAAEFVTSDEQLSRLRSLLGGGKRFPYFEVLLKTSRLSGTSLNAEPLAFRTYPALK